MGISFHISERHPRGGGAAIQGRECQHRVGLGRAVQCMGQFNRILELAAGIATRKWQSIPNHAECRDGQMKLLNGDLVTWINCGSDCVGEGLDGNLQLEIEVRNHHITSSSVEQSCPNRLWPTIASQATTTSWCDFPAWATR